MTISDAKTIETWKMDGFLQKFEKVVRIVLYGAAVWANQIAGKPVPAVSVAIQ